MFWEGREALEHSEANDRYFGLPVDEAEYGIPFEEPGDEDRGYAHGLEGIHVGGWGAEYEAGWQRGNALRRLRS